MGEEKSFESIVVRCSCIGFIQKGADFGVCISPFSSIIDEAAIDERQMRRNRGPSIERNGFNPTSWGLFWVPGKGFNKRGGDNRFHDIFQTQRKSWCRGRRCARVRGKTRGMVQLTRTRAGQSEG